MKRTRERKKKGRGINGREGDGRINWDRNEESVEARERDRGLEAKEKNARREKGGRGAREAKGESWEGAREEAREKA